MDFDVLLTPQAISAASVAISALIGGVLALIGEFRGGGDAETGAASGAESLGEVERRLSEQLREETDHIDRSVWIIERKLAERLAAIEARLAQLRR